MVGKICGGKKNCHSAECIAELNVSLSCQSFVGVLARNLLRYLPKEVLSSGRVSKF
jgi:hypothetical protein